MSYCHVFYTVKYSNYKIDPQYYINKMILLLVKANIASLPACFSELLSSSFKYISCIYFSSSFFFVPVGQYPIFKKAGSKQKLCKKRCKRERKKKITKFLVWKKLKHTFVKFLTAFPINFCFREFFNQVA